MPRTHHSGWRCLPSSDYLIGCAEGNLRACKRCFIQISQTGVATVRANRLSQIQDQKREQWPAVRAARMGSDLPSKSHLWAWFEDGSGKHFVPGFGGSCSSSPKTVSERMSNEAVLLKPGEHLDGTFRLDTKLSVV